MYTSIRQATSIFIISCINLLFSFKYLNRLENKSIMIVGMVLCFALPILFYILYVYTKKVDNIKIKTILYSRYLSWIFLLGLILFTIFFFVHYPQNLLKIDRFEMINLFWDNIFTNKCPYCPRTEGTNIPGPFPFYFYIFFPFYLINEVGYLSLLGVIVFILLLNHNRSVLKGISNTIILILLSCPAVIYEITCRSTIFLNSVLILCLFLLIKNYNLKNWQNIFIVSCATGLVLSTRSLSFLFVFLALIFIYKKNILHRNVIITGLLSAIVFISTFIPIILLCKKQFITTNPFTVQSSLVPTYYILIIAVFSSFITFFIKNLLTFCWYVGICCVALFIGHLYMYGNAGLVEAIVNSSVDISYISFSIPFLLYGMLEEPVLNEANYLKVS